MKKNKLGIIIFGIILVAILIVVGFFVIKDTKSDKVEEAKIASTITLDINPSIEINLDKYEKVINVIALNDDAKDLVNDDYTGKSLDNVITNITEVLIEKGYAEEKMVILLNTKGNISSSTIQNIITSTLETKKIDSEIIVQNTSANASANAKKYNISESKASLIEEIVKANDSKSFEDLKDKSISELVELKTSSKEESNTEEKIDNIEPSYTEPSNNTNYVSSPSDPTKDIDAWCAYNKNGNPYGHEKPMMLDTFELTQRLENHVTNTYGLTPWDLMIRGMGGNQQEDNRSSYCISYKFYFASRDWVKTYIVDSVTGEVIDEITESAPLINLTEDEALKKLLDYFNVTYDDILSDRSGATLTGDILYGNIRYYYSTSYVAKDGITQHGAQINATTGEINITM